jgi:aryl-alcohol dehydrogenase-like predicted oxidoreductase
VERTIGRIPVSLSGLGCNNFGRRLDAAAAAAVVHAALEAGVTVFDTADLYGDGASEEYLGKALGRRRDEAVVVTKFGMREPPAGLTGGSPEWVDRACRDSLARLGTDRIDVYLLHTPDPTTPVGETLEALGRLVADGLVREIGCSNFSAEQLDDAARAADTAGVPRFATVQNEYSLVEREPERAVLPACVRLEMSFMPYFPLASGLLTGKYRRGRPAPAGARLTGRGTGDRFLSDDRFDVVERLEAFATSRGHTLHGLALSWLAARPAVATVIAGATSAEQATANAAATTAWTLDDEDLREIDRQIGGGPST